MDLTELKKLNLPKDKFAVFGSGPLAIRRIRESKDIDIIVKQDLWRDLEKKYKKENERLIKINNIEIYNCWLPWILDINELIDDADIFEDIKFVKLKHLIKWKRAFNREKDKKDLELIENYFKKLKNLKN